MESRKSKELDKQHVLTEAEEGVSDLRNKEGWRNPFVQDFLLKEEVEYVKSSRNLSSYI